jgi:hypothetical protein
MAEFLAAERIIPQLKAIISNAREELVLVNTLVKLSDDSVIKSLKDAVNRRVKIKLVFKQVSLNQEAIEQLKTLSNLLVYYHKDLNACCYYNEAAMIITSLDLDSLSEPQTMAMGVLVTKKDDVDIYNAAAGELGEIIKKAEKVALEKETAGKQAPPQKASDSDNHVVPAEGYCIRCKWRIEFNTSQPYCLNCYNEWAEWDFQDHGYIESYCHRCRTRWATSLESPLCGVCGTPSDNAPVEVD